MKPHRYGGGPQICCPVIESRRKWNTFLQLIFVEKKKTDGSWPDSLPQDIAPPNLLPNTPSVSADAGNKSGWGHLFSGLYSKPPENPGLIGLVNLGNTCFMNSALQCLSNTAPLTDFFQQGLWRLDVNVNNPLGHKGVLAEAYAALMDELWRGENSVVAPRDFKKKVEKFAPQFSGYQQHDSVEFLNFLLDGLHDDLNRIKDKPYLPTIDLTGKSDEVVANEAWDWHLARNKSFIVDNFQGQLKSTVVCPQCGKVSITFDPVMYLSLPLVQYKPPSVSPDGETVVKYGVTVSSDSSVKDLKDCFSTLVGLPPYLLMLCDIQSSFCCALERQYVAAVIMERSCAHRHLERGKGQLRFLSQLCVPQIFVHPTSAAAKPSNIASEVSLDTCLDMFTSLEKLGANDLWYCPGCKSHQPAAKKLDFWKIPPTLIVHLKRFKERCWQDKLDIPVRFPVTNLYMTKRVLSGNGTPLRCLWTEDTWCHFDDNSATKTSENSLSSTDAYVLFYQGINRLPSISELLLVMLSKQMLLAMGVEKWTLWETD
ncbi:ubiquitin carboxyl-terminal hydrolase 4 [Pelomyxa schiedti]|nr:ubiquitin carboxyl-terminal hydrolase 4 [Pelomyxa schiedti]